MSSTPKQQQVVQSTQLPPQYQQAFTSILNQANALQPQPVMQRVWNPGGVDTGDYYGGANSGGYYSMAPTGEYSGGVTSVVPELSPQTQSGLEILQAQPNQLVVKQLNQLATGSIPTGVEDAVIRAATRAVSDRFSQAGRTGSPGEALSLGKTVSDSLAPYAFSGQQSALNSLLGLDQQRAQNMLNAGSILEQQQREKMLEPFTLFNLRTDPLIRALGGAPTTTTTTQPVNRNVGAGILGGVATGAGLGMLGAAEGATGLAALGPWGIPLMIGGGLLGAL